MECTLQTHYNIIIEPVLLPEGIGHMHCKANAANIQPTLHVHSRYTAGALQFKLGPNKGRWAHFNVKLHFFLIRFTLM